MNIFRNLHTLYPLLILDSLYFYLWYRPGKILDVSKNAKTATYLCRTRKQYNRET